MSYTKYTWVTGEVITAAKLNHMEDGIEAAGKTFEAEYDEANSYLVIKATPEELYAGAIALESVGGGETLHLCLQKSINPISENEQAIFMVLQGSSLVTATYDYNEAAGGYIPHSDDGGGGGGGQ